MHPDKFLKRGKVGGTVLSSMSADDRAEQLSMLGKTLAEKRDEAVTARKNSGIEDIWLRCEEATIGIDDMNRHEFAGAKWAKPMAISGPLTSNSPKKDDVRSNAFVPLTSQYVNAGTARLAEILLPIDDKAFSLTGTPDPDLIKSSKDLRPILDASGNQVMMPADQGLPTPQAAPVPGQPGTPPAQKPMTVADRAQQLVDQANEAAEKAEKRVWDWMVECNSAAENRKVMYDAGRIGVGVLKGPFPEVKKAKAVTRPAKNAIALQISEKIVPVVRWVDPWNIFPDPACGEDIHSGEYILERDYLSPRKLRELKGRQSQGYMDDMIDKVLAEGPNKCYEEGSTSTSQKDKQKRSRFEVWYLTGQLPKDQATLAGAPGLEDLEEDSDFVNVIVMLVNDTVIRVTINPLDSGAFPYHAVPWSRRANSWAGIGLAEQCFTAQRSVNAATRALFNNLGVGSGVQIVMNPIGLVPADGSWAITPNKIWHLSGDVQTDDVGKMFRIFQIPVIQKELMATIEYAMQMADRATNVPLLSQGQFGQKMPETFGQAELLNTNANTLLRSIGYLYDDYITEPLIHQFYEWLLLDPDVPDEEKGDFNINAHGSAALVERAIQEQTLMQMSQMVLQPAFKVDPAKWFAEMARSKRMDPRKLQYTDEEQAQMMQQPAQPPLPIAVEQLKGQNALAVIQAKAQAELQMEQQQMQAEQQMLQRGGSTPHEATALARVTQEKIRANTAENVQLARGQAELARADKEQEIAQQNGQYRIQELQLQKEIALLDYANKRQINLDQVKSQLAKSAMDNQTKKELAAAEIALAQSEGSKDRVIDVHKHNTSLIRDEISTDNTP